VTTVEACTASGATYRQLDYWIKLGYLKPDNAKDGSGSQRTWNGTEVAVAHLMIRLLRVGFIPKKASEIARSVVNGEPSTQLDQGIYLDINLDKE
jgi:DNA-binding transcriptional MerR regulator